LNGYTGSLIKRPIKSTLGLYKHFGIIYGFDKNNTLWIIENNINGVECVTLRDFLQNQSDFRIEHNMNENTCNEIIERAVSRGGITYDARTNNCEHFVNYCLNKNHSSIQVDNTEIAANYILSLVEMRIKFSPNSSDHDILKHSNKLRKVLKLERPKEVQKLFNAKKSRTKKTSKEIGLLKTKS
jgi:hypothetical protein